MHICYHVNSEGKKKLFHLPPPPNCCVPFRTADDAGQMQGLLVPCYPDGAGLLHMDQLLIVCQQSAGYYGRQEHFPFHSVINLFFGTFSPLKFINAFSAGEKTQKVLQQEGSEFGSVVEEEGEVEEDVRQPEKSDTEEQEQKEDEREEQGEDEEGEEVDEEKKKERAEDEEEKQQPDSTQTNIPPGHPDEILQQNKPTISTKTLQDNGRGNSNM